MYVVKLGSQKRRVLTWREVLVRNRNRVRVRHSRRRTRLRSRSRLCNRFRNRYRNRWQPPRQQEPGGWCTSWRFFCCVGMLSAAWGCCGCWGWCRCPVVRTPYIPPRAAPGHFHAVTLRHEQPVTHSHSECVRWPSAAKRAPAPISFLKLGRRWPNYKTALGQCLVSVLPCKDR